MLKVPSQITKVETTSDGRMKLAIHTNDLDSATKAALMEWHNRFGWLVFAPTSKQWPLMPPDIY